MADVPTPKSKVDVDPNFEKQIKALRDHAAAEAAARNVGGQVKWFRPAGWNGDPFDYAGIGTALNRDGPNQGMIDAIKDQDNPGTTGDVVAAATMIGRLATLERAMKARHTLRRIRATAHVIGRKRGHGQDTGPLVQLGLEFVRGVVKQSRGTGSGNGS